VALSAKIADHERRIDFNRGCCVGREREYLEQAILGRHLSGDGPFTKKCQALLEELLGARKVLLTTSCTHALEMAALLLDLKAGDEVILPSFTFTSTANAFALRGARLVFADITPDTLNLDPGEVARLMTACTRAVVPVHYAGVGCDLDAISRLVKTRDDVVIVEDNAHGLFGTYRGKPLGTFGSLATQSFHETKNISCGEGGALVINDPRYVERAEMVREKGTNRSRYFRGQVDKYTWTDLGSSYIPSDLLAAFLLAQLERRAQVQAARQRIWEIYDERLRSLARRVELRLPHVPELCTQPYHLYYILLPSLEQRQGLIAHLRALGIGSAFHYLPLHLSDMGQRFGGKPGDCPVTESVADRLLRLPLHYELSESDAERVVAGVASFFGIEA
jgi:dTDP-4-amino-4,6-dideoxygalactose transaminase